MRERAEFESHDKEVKNQSEIIAIRSKLSTEKVRVTHGVNTGYYDLQGKTIAKVKKSLREVHNIPSDAVAMINGYEVGDDFVLEGGMNVEFYREAGEKGDEIFKFL